MAAGRGVTVWDLPTRVFHWGLVFCLAGSWYTAGDEEQLETHLLFGYGSLGLLLFRIVWGFVGSDTARFRGFIRGPAEAATHIRHLLSPRPLERHAGHNPLGGYAVLAMLSLVGIQVGTGLFLSGGDIFLVAGPLNGFVSSGVESRLEDIHGLTFNALQVLVVIHVLAVLAYAVLKRQDLIRPMLTGRAPLDGPAPRMAPLPLALAIAAAAASAVWGVSSLG